MQAAAEEAHSKSNVRKSMVSVIQKPTAQSNKKVPSYMKSTHTSQTRMSLEGAAVMDARFAH